MSTEIILEADDTSGYLAELKVQYSWNLTGTEFICTALQYRATNNGRKSGNAFLRIVIDGKNNDSGDFLNDNGVQDGQWHNIQNKSWTIRNVVGTSARLIFTWTFDITGSPDKHLGPKNPPTVNFIPRSPIINPIKNFAASTFNVTGTLGVAGALMVLDHGAGTLAARVQPTGGDWSVPVTVADNVNSQRMQAYQQVNGGNSPRTPLTYMYRAKLTHPTAGAVVPMKDFVYEAIGAPGSAMYALGMEWSDQYSEQKLVGPSGNWQAPSTHIFPSGDAEVRVRFYDDPAATASYGYTQSVVFKVLGYPVITNTQFIVREGFLLTGRNRLSGATLTAYIGASNTTVGTAGAATTDTFSITTNNLDPGAHALTVEQFHSGKGSGRSAAVTFKIQPNQPTLAFKLESDIPTLHGTGFRNASVDVAIHNNGSFIDAVVGSNGTWSKAVPVTVLPGNYNLVCRQNVKDQDNVPIWSTYTTPQTFTIPTPVPTSLTSNKNGHKLTFSGRGQNWGTNQVVVVIFNNGADMRPGVPAGTVTNQAWSIISTTDFAPGNYTQLTAKLWVNNHWSQPVPVPAVIIPSPPPELTPITGPTGQRPQIGGTMWSGSKVEVQINGGPAKTATTAGSRFYLNATSDWDPGTYAVRVIAEFGGQTSTPSTQSFTVRAPQPKILTTGAVPLQATIIGEGWKGCRVRIFTTIGNQELGADNVKSDGKFEIALLKQAAGDQTLYAVQYQSDNLENKSVESARVAVKFGIPTADVTVPPEGGTTPRVSTFSGTTAARSGTVELWLEGVPLRTNIAISNGTWSSPGIKLDAGLKAVLVYIRDGNDLSTATTRNVKVVPEKLKIDSPLTNQYIGRQLLISGVGAVPGDQVIVRRLQTSLDFPPVTVDPRGYWTTSVQHNMTASSRIVAIARAETGLDSETSDQIIPRLLHTAPQITQPQAGDRVGTKPVFSGRARPGATVTIAQWFNNTIVLATTTARADGYWEAPSTVALAEGGGWVQVRDTLNNQPSEWSRSERFEVRPMTAAPAPPSIQHP